MPVKAQVPNLGTIILENAAEESTMKAILAALSKGGAVPAGGSAKAAAPLAGAAAEDDAMTKRANALEKGAEAEEKYAKRMKMAGDSVAFGAEMFGKTFSNTTPGLKDFAGVLGQMPIGNLGGIKPVLTQFGGALGDQIEIFRSLSTAGIDLGDSLLASQLMAAESRLPMELFGKTVKENSSTLAMAFGGATQGAAKFADVQGKFMAQSGQKFAALGFSMDELASYNASYMEQQQRSGRLSRMSTEEIVAGQERYNTELDRLSKATGLSRQQLDEANKAAQRDARMKLALGKLDSDQQAAVNAKIAQLEKLDPTGKMAAGFKDLIAGGGVALTAEARQFTLAMSSAGVDAAKMGRDIFTGSKTAIEGMNAGFSKAAKASETITEGERRTAAAMATMGQVTPALGKAVLQGMGDVQKATKAAEEEQKKRLGAAQTDPTRAVAGLDQTLTQVQNSFKKSLIESGVFEMTAKGFEVATAAADKLAKGLEAIPAGARLPTFMGAAAAAQITDALIKSGLQGLQGYAGARALDMDKKTYDEFKKDKTKMPGGPESKPSSGLPKPPGMDSVDDVVKEASKWEKFKEFLGGKKKLITGIILGGAGGAYYLYNGDTVDEAKVPKLGAQPAVEPPKDNKTVVPGAEIPKATVNTQEIAVQEQAAKLKTDITALKTALDGIDYSKLIFPETVGTSIDAGAIKLKNLRDEITTTTSAFKDFNNVNLDKLNENLNKLGEALKNSAVTKEASASNQTQPIIGDAASKEVVSLLNQLNMNMSNLASMQGDAVDYLSKTARYTRQSSNNIV